MKKGKNRVNEFIESEEADLQRLEREMNRLKAKWFKLSSHKKLINFLEYYCKEKRKIITALKTRGDDQPLF